MVDKDKIMRLLNQYFITTQEVSIDDQGLISCTGGVTLKEEHKLERLPVAFDRVGRFFNCSRNQLKTLEGAPNNVGGGFYCSDNQLITLEHAPTSLSGNFWCNGNKLTTLEGLPAVKGVLQLSYSGTLPLLRCLLAEKIEFFPIAFFSTPEEKTVGNILNNYAGQGEAGAFACGAELASAGFKENAKW